MADREAVREQFVEAFEGANYPVNSPMDLVPALPNGPATRFEIDDETSTAMELNQRAQGEAPYPYDSVDELVEALLDGFEDRGHIRTVASESPRPCPRPPSPPLASDRRRSVLPPENVRYRSESTGPVRPTRRPPWSA
jgi:hypothetical protein